MEDRRGSKRAFQNALEHLFAETERQLQPDATAADTERRAARATSGSGTNRSRRDAAPASAASATAAPAPVTGGLFLDSDALDDDDGSLGDAEADAARLAREDQPPSPMQAFGADTLRSGRHSARNGGAGDVSSRTRAQSSGRAAASSGSSSVYTSAGEGGFDTYPRVPLVYAAGPSHHELELLQRVEHVRASVEHYRQSAELAGRVLDTKVKSQLQNLVSKLNIQLRELEDRLNSHYATSANISLNHTLEFRRKIKSDLKNFKMQMEAWCAGETKRLQAIEVKVNEQKETNTAAAAVGSPAAARTAASIAADTRSPAPIQALQLQQQLLADRQELLSLKLNLEQAAIRDAAREKAYREEMDELRAEIRRMQGVAPARALAPLHGASASPTSPNNGVPLSHRGSEAPTRSEFQHLQSLFHRLEHSHNTQAVDFSHLQQSHERHMELVAQSQLKAAQRSEEREQEATLRANRIEEQLAALQQQVDGTASARFASAATSPSTGLRSAPKSPSQGSGASAVADEPNREALQSEVDKHRRLFDAVGAELKEHADRLTALDQAQSAAAAATAAAVAGHAESHKVAELLSSTLSKLDDEVGDLAAKVTALQDAVPNAAAAASPDADTATHAAQQSQHDRLLTRVSALDSEVHVLSERLSSFESSVPSSIESLRASQNVLLGELEKQSGAHLDRSAARTATVAEIAAQVTALEEKVGTLALAVSTSSKDAARFREMIQEEFVECLEQVRMIDERTAAAADGAAAAGGGLPPALRTVLESLQQQLNALAHRGEDGETYLASELEKQSVLLQRHDEILRTFDNGQITEEEDEGEGEERPSSSSSRARPPSPPSRAQLQWQRKQAQLAREAAGKEDPLDEVSMDFPSATAGYLSVHIPQTRPGSSQSVLSTHSVHPTAAGFDSRPVSASAEGSGMPSPDVVAGSPRAATTIPRSPAAKREATAMIQEDARSAALSSSRNNSRVNSAANTPSSKKSASAAATPSSPAIASKQSPAATSSVTKMSVARSATPDSEDYQDDFLSPAASPQAESKSLTSPTAGAEKGTSPAKALDFSLSAPSAATSAIASAAPAAALSAATVFRPSNSATCRTAAEFGRLRQELRAYGIDRLIADQLSAGWLTKDAASGSISIAADAKPFNPFARLVSGALSAPYGNLLEQRGVTDPAAKHFMIARNRPELDAAWNDHSKEMLGKASMAQRHEFLLLRDLTQWERFNASTFGIRGDAKSLTDSIQLVDDASRVAKAYATSSGWGGELGLFVHAFPFNSVHALHVHMLDLGSTGPSFHHLAHKNLPLQSVRDVLLSELRVVDAKAADRLAKPAQVTSRASEQEEADERAEEVDEEEGIDEEYDEEPEEEEEMNTRPAKKSSIGAAAEASARVALRSELDGKRLELFISCGELPVANTAVLLSEKLSAAASSSATADAGGFVKRGWTEAVSCQANPAYETPLFVTFHADGAGEQGSSTQEIRLELFDTAATSGRLGLHHQQQAQSYYSIIRLFGETLISMF